MEKIELLEQGKKAMTDTISIGTAGLSLIGHIEGLMEHSVAMAQIVDEMDEFYTGNMMNAVGDEGMQEVEWLYGIAQQIKQRYNI